MGILNQRRQSLTQIWTLKTNLANFYQYSDINEILKPALATRTLPHWNFVILYSSKDVGGCCIVMNWLITFLLQTLFLPRPFPLGKDVVNMQQLRGQGWGGGDA